MKLWKKILIFFLCGFVIVGVSSISKGQDIAFSIFMMIISGTGLFFIFKKSGKNGLKRKNAKSELKDFFRSKPKTIIVLDLETNGFSKSGRSMANEEKRSVLSVAALKYSIDEQYNLTESDRFVRYYFSKEKEDAQAIMVNGLTKEKIEKLRGEDCSYPKYFFEDFEAFKLFCSDTTHYVIFNADFDMRFISIAEKQANKPWKIFDAMKTNTNIVRTEWLEYKKGWKWPTLKETIEFYGIPASTSELHAADYDAEMTAKIFETMIERAGLKNLAK